MPRDRAGTFELQLVKKRQRRLAGFDDKVISLYARGLTTRDIQAHLQELYGAEVSPMLVSAVTESVIDDLKAWQMRPLEAVYPHPVLRCAVREIAPGRPGGRPRRLPRPRGQSPRPTASPRRVPFWAI